MVEFSLIALPMILAGIGAVELTHWVYVRQAVGAALVSAAKAGSTYHANPSAIARAFERGLAPLYPARPNQAASQAFIGTRTGSATHGQLVSSWHIQIQSPSAAVFSDFPANVNGGIMENHPTIRNSYQREQHLKALNKGWLNGTGPQSGETIFQANTLSLRLTYPYAPLVPGLSALAPEPLAIRRQVQVVMQSNPMLWPESTNTRVTRTPWQGVLTDIRNKKKVIPGSTPNENNLGTAPPKTGNPNQNTNTGEAGQPQAGSNPPPLHPDAGSNPPASDAGTSCVSGQMYRNAKYVQKHRPVSPSPTPNARAPRQQPFQSANRAPRLPTHCYAS